MSNLSNHQQPSQANTNPFLDLAASDPPPPQQQAQHHPNNPFVHSTTASPPAQQQVQHLAPPAQAPPPPTANDFAAQLAGLDLSSQGQLKQPAPQAQALAPSLPQPAQHHHHQAYAPQESTPREYTDYQRYAALDAPTPQQPLQQGVTPPQPPQQQQQEQQQQPDEEALWSTKDIYWKGQWVKTVMQNENGPCSLIALCNILLLRGELKIHPPDRPAVSYTYLSSLLAEHLLSLTSDGSSALDFDAALSILPSTQHGLDVNVRFDAIDGFSGPASQRPDKGKGRDTGATSGSSSGAAAPAPPGPLALFRLCKVPLVHGWLADPSDEETSAALLRAGTYEGAQDVVVRGDELTEGGVVRGAGRQGSLRVDNLTSEQQQSVNDALLIHNFFEQSKSQLTYHGLFTLASTLEPGRLYALFRNSHLSVLYRRLPGELPTNPNRGDQAAQQSAAATPELLQLVTDSSFLLEEDIVWESLEDVDGHGSAFFNGQLAPSRPQQQQQQAVGPNGVAPTPGEDADFALAMSIHMDEQRRVEERDARRYYRRQQQQQQFAPQSQRSGGLLDRLRGGSKKSGAGVATTTTTTTADDQTRQGVLSAREDLGGAGAGSGSGGGGKWWKKFKGGRRGGDEAASGANATATAAGATGA